MARRGPRVMSKRDNDNSGIGQKSRVASKAFFAVTPAEPPRAHLRFVTGIRPSTCIASPVRLPLRTERRNAPGTRVSKRERLCASHTRAGYPWSAVQPAPRARSAFREPVRQLSQNRR